MYIRAGEPEPVGTECFWLLGSRSPLKKKQELEPAPIAKKSGVVADSSAPREYKKHKEIVHLLT